MNGDLVVLDDDDDLLDAVAELVEATTERKVWKARSVAELMTLGSRALACELAILDVNLGANAPSGLDALSWLNECNFKGRACFLTGHAASHQLVQDAHISPNVPVFSKPISGDDLLALLEQHDDRN
jgi:ActR/RegA family two-component response regulator